MYLCRSPCISQFGKWAIDVSFQRIIPWVGNAIAEIYIYMHTLKFEVVCSG